MSDDRKSGDVAKVDYLIDEKGSRIDVPDNSGIRVAGEHDASVGAAGPTNWLLYGLVAMALVLAFLLLLQVFSGAPGTDVQPGTPTSQPVTEQMAPPPSQ